MGLNWICSLTFWRPDVQGQGKDGAGPLWRGRPSQAPSQAPSQLGAAPRLWAVTPVSGLVSAWPLPSVSYVLIRTAVFGFRAHPKPSTASSETCSLITSAKTLCPSEVAFAGAGVDSDLRCWGHGLTHYSTVLDLGSTGSCVSDWGQGSARGEPGLVPGQPAAPLLASAFLSPLEGGWPEDMLGTASAPMLPHPGVTPGSVLVPVGASEHETAWQSLQPGRLGAVGAGLWGHSLATTLCPLFQLVPTRRVAARRSGSSWRGLWVGPGPGGSE